MILHFRKRAIISKINAMGMDEKSAFLNTLCEPFGYAYDKCQDIFTTRQNPPQKHFGYTTAYDLTAPYFNMIFDYETIYFDYHNRTWLIQMWKGQYGITSGCELGLYYTDTIIPPESYDIALFKAVEMDDMLPITLKLNCHRPSGDCCRLGQRKGRHWWLTLFKLGTFTEPEQLFVNTSIRFKDSAMLRAFLESFSRTLPSVFLKVNGLTVYFTFSQSFRKYSIWKRLVRRLALLSCQTLCKWFQFVTRFYSNTGDKLLYLYFYLPFTVRLLFRHTSQTQNGGASS